MLLAIDVGNTNITLGVFDGRTLVASWRLQTLRERTADELGLTVDGLLAHGRIDRARVDSVIISSVVPPLTGSTVGMVQRFFGLTPFVVDPASNTGMPIKYDAPGDVGADRVVGAIAAYDQFGASGTPVIVCDFGTATTFDAVTAAGEYLGGAICPGVNISADALFQRAARLPRVEVRKPKTVIGRNTVGAIQAGLFYGYVGMVEGLITRMRGELGGRAVCVATGGLAAAIAPETTLIDHVEPDLLLHGMRIVWDRNR